MGERGANERRFGFGTGGGKVFGCGTSDKRIAGRKKKDNAETQSAQRSDEVGKIDCGGMAALPVVGGSNVRTWGAAVLRPYMGLLRLRGLLVAAEVDVEIGEGAGVV